MEALNTENPPIFIRQALEDLEKTEQHEFMSVNMANWVCPMFGLFCGWNYGSP